MILHLAKENETPRALLESTGMTVISKTAKEKWDLIPVVYEKHTGTFKDTICEKARGKISLIKACCH